MRNRGFLAGLIVGAIHFAFACSANAALLTFTDRSAWQVAAGGVGDKFQNFDSFPEQAYGAGGGGPGPPDRRISYVVGSEWGRGRG